MLSHIHSPTWLIQGRPRTAPKCHSALVGEGSEHGEGVLHAREV